MTAPASLAIRRLSIVASSPIEARRLADALPAAMERALGATPDRPLRRPQLADRIAAQIVARLARATEGER